MDPTILDLTAADPAAPERAAADPDAAPPQPGADTPAAPGPTASGSATLVLPPRLDLNAVGALQAELLARRGQDLTLDAGKVEHLGAIGLQLIRSAARSWAEDGHVLTCTDASTDLADQMVLLGLTPETLTRWEPAQ